MDGRFFLPHTTQRFTRCLRHTRPRSLSTETCLNGRSYAKVWRSSRPRNALPEISSTDRNQQFFWKPIISSIFITKGSFMTLHNPTPQTVCWHNLPPKVWYERQISFKILSRGRPSVLFLKQIAFLAASQPKAVILASTCKASLGRRRLWFGEWGVRMVLLTVL